jgi:hypothetical protein
MPGAPQSTAATGLRVGDDYQSLVLRQVAFSQVVGGVHLVKNQNFGSNDPGFGEIAYFFQI